MGTFRQRQGQRCPGGGLFGKHLPTTPTEQTDDSPQGREHLTARTHTHTVPERICDCKLRRNLENNLPPSRHTPTQKLFLSVCVFQRHTRTHRK